MSKVSSCTTAYFLKARTKKPAVLGLSMPTSRIRAIPLPTRRYCRTCRSDPRPPATMYSFFPRTLCPSFKGSRSLKLNRMNQAKIGSLTGGEKVIELKQNSFSQCVTIDVTEKPHRSCDMITVSWLGLFVTFGRVPLIRGPVVDRAPVLGTNERETQSCLPNLDEIVVYSSSEFSVYRCSHE